MKTVFHFYVAGEIDYLPTRPKGYMQAKLGGLCAVGARPPLLTRGQAVVQAKLAGARWSFHASRELAEAAVSRGVSNGDSDKKE